MWMQGDVRKNEDCIAAIQNTIKHFGRLDILINGAAGNFLAQAEKLSANGFKAVMDIDASGAFQMSQAAFKGYMKQNGGVIINVSAQVHTNGSILQIHAAAGKAALEGMTKTLACEWGPYNVRVVTLTPGTIAETEGFSRLANLKLMNSGSAAKGAANDAANLKIAEKVREEGSKMVPMQRFGLPNDISCAAMYLSSDAGQYITGANIVIDGGVYMTFPNW